MRRPGHFAQTRYGFEWGPLTVTRVAHDEKRLGYVVWIEGEKGQAIEVRVTPTGRRITATEIDPRLVSTDKEAR